jgi:putative DNA primase/helicase
MRLANFNEASQAAPGEYRAPCPECDRGPRDDALGVTVTHAGWVAHCFRCGWASATGREVQRPAHRPAPRPDGLSEWAAELWQSTRPLAGEARAYIEARACAIPPADSDLRWLPQLRHAPTGYTGPALVALVTDAVTNEPISLHRTWIRPDGTKAPITPSRMLAANHRAKGGVIRLWPDEAVTLGLAVAEGIETALSVAHAFAPAWSVIDAGNLAAFPVLNGIDSLLIAADGDPVGRKAAEDCAVRWLAAGREVSIVDPGEGHDWNDEAAA